MQAGRHQTRPDQTGERLALDSNAPPQAHQGLSFGRLARTGLDWKELVNQCPPALFQALATFLSGRPAAGRLVIVAGWRDA